MTPNSKNYCTRGFKIVFVITLYFITSYDFYFFVFLSGQLFLIILIGYKILYPIGIVGYKILYPIELVGYKILYPIGIVQKIPSNFRSRKFPSNFRSRKLDYTN